MPRYSWIQISNEWDKLMDLFEGPNSLRYQLFSMAVSEGKSSFLTKKILIEFSKEIDKEKNLAFDTLWIQSGWNEREFVNELNCRLDSEHYGDPRFSCAKYLKNIPERCVLDIGHDGICQGYIFV